MVINDLFFAGHWLSEFGGFITDKPQYEVAERDSEMVEIPGRSGDLYFDKNRYKNKEFERNIGFKKRAGLPVEKQIENIIAWLAYAGGYQKFTDTLHKGYSTRAVLTNLNDVIRNSQRLTSTAFHFNRLPYWYSDEGQIPLPINLSPQTAEIELFNPELETAAPIFKFKSTSNQAQPNYVTLNINDGEFEETYNFTFGHPYKTNLTEFIIDLEQKQIYLRNPKTGDYEYVYGDLPPELPTGKSTITVGVGNGQIKGFIIPNWRRL